MPDDAPVAQRPHDPAALVPGTRFDEFEILRVLAVGGFGIVYLGRDHALDRHVAIKEYMPAQLAGRSHGQRVSARSAADEPTYALGLQSFVDEAKLLAGFAHPAVVKVHRFWKANGTGYMVMPYLRGPTLDSVRRSMSEPPTERWLRQMLDPLLDALAMLHADGYYHRDISPDNVLVAENGIPVLLDFGAARRLLEQRSQTPTAILKPRYSPIEQYGEGKMLRQGPWTDLYSLGALAAFLVEGTPPPQATTRAIHDEMDPLASRRIPGVSLRFLSAMDWALAVRPQDRPQSVAQLRDALNGRRIVPPRWPSAASGMVIDAAPPAPALSRAQPRSASEPAMAPAAAAPARRAPWRRWTMLAGTAGLALLAGWFATRVPLGFAGAAQAALAAPAGVVAPAATAAAQAVAPLPSPVPPTAAAGVELPASPAPATAVGRGLVAAAPQAPTALAPPSSQSDARLAAAQATYPPSPRPLRAAGTPTRSTAAATRVASSSKAIAKPRAAVARPSERQLVRHATRVAAPGPQEACSSRNLFMRGYCVQKLCDERRFRSHAQCERVRQVVGYRD